jgi:manganese/zinc/iron transport system permease protein
MSDYLIHLGLMGPSAHLAWWTIAVGAIVNAACAMLGCYLVLQRLSLLGDAISHAVLPGIVVAFLFAGRSSFVPLFLGAMLTGILTTFLIETLRQYAGVGDDTGMGIVFTALFSLGVVLMSNLARDVDLDVSCILMGQIENVPLDVVDFAGITIPRVLPTMTAALLLVSVFVALFWKEMKLASFDPALATALGFSAVLLHYLLMALTAVVTVAAFEAVGSILSVTMLVVPPATASLLTDRLKRMFVWSVVAAVSASFFGYLGAAAWNVSTAGMMAVVAGLQFAAAVLLAPRHGWLRRIWDSWQLSLRITAEDLTATLFRDEETGALRSGDGLPIDELLRRGGRGFVPTLALRQLRRRGAVHDVGPGRVALTERGRADAESLVRTHRLWEAYLVENFQLPLDHLHDPAERIEHFIGPALQQQLAESLPKADIDPHGREIPPARPTP